MGTDTGTATRTVKTDRDTFRQQVNEILASEPNLYKDAAKVFGESSQTAHDELQRAIDSDTRDNFNEDGSFKVTEDGPPNVDGLVEFYREQIDAVELRASVEDDGDDE